MATIFETLPGDIQQNIKAYELRDRDRSSPTATCIRELILAYAKECDFTEADLDENDGDWMCLSIAHFRENYFHGILCKRLILAWFGR